MLRNKSPLFQNCCFSFGGIVLIGPPSYLAFSQSGYDDTWLRLKARYQNGKILVFAAIGKMIDHKPIGGSLRQLRALHDTIKNSMSTLKALISAQNPGIQSCVLL